MLLRKARAVRSLVPFAPEYRNPLMLRDENPEPEIYPLILGLDGRAWRHSEAANADADHGLSAADGSEQRLRLATDIGYGGSGCGMARAATTAAAPSAVVALAFFAMAADGNPS